MFCLQRLSHEVSELVSSLLVCKSKASVQIGVERGVYHGNADDIKFYLLIVHR